MGLSFDDTTYIDRTIVLRDVAARCSKAADDAKMDGHDFRMRRSNGPNRA